MKSNVGLIMLVVLFAGATLVSAEGMKDGMMGKRMMGKGMMGMDHGMMESMMKKQVVATTDGGIVVVTANKLTKYDKDLKVVKEVELKMDMEGMKKMMDQMKSMCPMMDKDTMGEMKKDSDGDDDDDAPAKVDEHAGHHPETK